MQFSNHIFIQITIFALSVCGFIVSKHIRNHKIKNTPLVCPIGFDCNAVVHSDYSKFFGMPVEILGMIYYALISLVYLALIFLGEYMPEAVNGIMAGASLGAFIFSLYLISVQIFILKKGCSWCIVSSIISACIFILTVFNYDFSSIAEIFSK